MFAGKARKPLSGNCLQGRLVAKLTNIRLGLKEFSRVNTLAYR